VSESPYDKIPYSNNCFPETHPRRMRTAGVLLGLSPPPHETARVLELGCGRGGNLLPMAEQYPEARFVGIDLSERQIAEAKEATAHVGAPNIEFRHMSITDVTKAFGEFDYVICHGVFSWVPPAVRDHILTVCRENLSPTGVAFISYNTYPGWHLRGLARDVMNYHAKHCADPEEGLAEARTLLRLLAEAPILQSRPISTVLKSEVEQIKDKDDAYLLHEYLEEYNQPYYFHEFMTLAAGAGLQYLADGRANAFPVAQVGKEAAAFVERYAGDVVRAEQYADFFRSQMFRRSYVCRAGQPVDWPGAAGRTLGLHVTSSLRRRPDAKVAHKDQVQFATPRGNGVVSGDPLVKAALAALEAAFPRAIPFEALCDQVLAAVKVPPAQGAAVRSQLAAQVSGFWKGNLLELDVTPATFAHAVTERPKASPVARLYAKAQALVPTRRHDMASLDDVGRQVIQLVDGSRTSEQMLDVFLADKPHVKRDGVRAQLTQLLNGFAGQALLVG